MSLTKIQDQTVGRSVCNPGGRALRWVWLIGADAVGTADNFDYATEASEASSLDVATSRGTVREADFCWLVSVLQAHWIGLYCAHALLWVFRSLLLLLGASLS